MPAKNQSSIAIICILTGISATLWLIHLITGILHAKDPHIENIFLMQAAAAFDILAKLALVITSLMVLHNIPNEGDYRYALLVGTCSSLVLILACSAGFTGNLVTEKATRTRLIQSVGLMEGEKDQDSFWNTVVALIEELNAQIASNDLIDAYTNNKSLNSKKTKLKSLIGYDRKGTDPTSDKNNLEWSYQFINYAAVVKQYQEHKTGVELLQQIELGFEMAFMINMLVFLTLVCWVLEQKYWELIAMQVVGILVLVGYGVAGIKKSALVAESLEAVFYALVIMSLLDIMVVISRSQHS